MAPLFTGSKFGFGRSAEVAGPPIAVYPDPDAASLYFAYSYDNTNQVNDVQNIIRAANGQSNGTLKNITKGSSASFSSTRSKNYTHSLYSGNDYTNGNTYASHATMGIDFYRMKLPFTVQFWVYYNTAPFNNFPSQYPGDMGAQYEPISGRSGWGLAIHATSVQLFGYYSGDSGRNVNASTSNTTSGEWNHFAIAAAGGGTDTRVYKNGVLLSNTSDTMKNNDVNSYGATANPSGSIYISGRGNQFAYDGRQDYSDAYYQDVKWYSIARSESNIQQEYNNGVKIINAT